MATLVLINELSQSLRLGRRNVRSGTPSWQFKEFRTAVNVLAPGEICSLGDVKFVYVTADGPVKLGWGNPAVEIDVKSLTVLTSTMTAVYVQNPTGALLPVSVNVVTAND